MSSCYLTPNLKRIPNYKGPRKGDVAPFYTKDGKVAVSTRKLDKWSIKIPYWFARGLVFWRIGKWVGV